MTLRVFLVLAVLFASAEAGAERVDHGNIITENIPETPQALRETLRRYQNVRAARLGGWAVDGQGLFVITGFGQTPQAHFVSEPGGLSRQLTFFNEPIGELAPSPVDSNLFAFTRDIGGDENYQVFVFDRMAGTLQRVSDGVGRKGSLRWSRNGQKLSWYTTLEGSKRAIVVADINNAGMRKKVYTGDGWWSPADWSPDGATLLLYHYVSINESSIYLLNLWSGALTPINQKDARIAYGDAKFSHNGKSIYFTSDEGGEFLNLYRYALRTGKKKNLTRNIQWDVEDFEISSAGAIAFTVNRGGRSTLHLRTRFDRPLPAPRLPTGIVENMKFSPDGRWLAFTYDAAAAPGDVFSIRVSRRLKDVQRWTQSEAGGLDREGFIEPSFFSYPSFDIENGKLREIPAFIYKPRGAGPYPVVIAIHGGPEGQARPLFSAQYQYWAKELGIAVIRPNVRGSAGYGKSYLKLDNGMMREDSVRDIGALINWIEKQPDLDANKIIVYGASYGGYMSLASMLHYHDRLAGGVDIFGITNFVTFLENTADYRRDLRRAEYGDERDPEMRACLERISPRNNVGKISKPILIVQGLNDPRVPASESEEIVNAFRASGNSPWYMLAKDEGHGFKKKSNRSALSEVVVMFFVEVFDIDISAGEKNLAPDDQK